MIGKVAKGHELCTRSLSCQLVFTQAMLHSTWQRDYVRQKPFPAAISSLLKFDFQATSRERHRKPHANSDVYTMLEDKPPPLPLKTS